MKFDVQAALDEILTESIAPAISANPAIPPPKLASIARIAVKEVETQDIEFDTKARPDDHEAYAEALRIHGPMSYGMAMRVLGWGGTRAGQAEDALRLASRVEFNEQGWACLSGIKKSFKTARIMGGIDEKKCAVICSNRRGYPDRACVERSVQYR